MCPVPTVTGGEAEGKGRQRGRGGGGTQWETLVLGAKDIG